MYDREKRFFHSVANVITRTPSAINRVPIFFFFFYGLSVFKIENIPFWNPLDSVAIRARKYTDDSIYEKSRGYCRAIEIHMEFGKNTVARAQGQWVKFTQTIKKLHRSVGVNSVITTYPRS